MDMPGTGADTYRQSIVPVLFEPWARWLVQILDPQPGERILDIARGTGIVARVAASHASPAPPVTMLDISQAGETLTGGGVRPEEHGIEGREGTAESMPFPGGSFDVVLCQFALMFVRDPHAAITEMHRVLDDHGRLGISVWQEIERHPFHETLHDVIRWHLGASDVSTAFALGDAEALRAMVTDAGFHTIGIRSLSMTARFPGRGGFLIAMIEEATAASPAMQELTAEGRQTLISQICDDMSAALATVTDGDHLAIPFHAHILSAHR